MAVLHGTTEVASCDAHTGHDERIRGFYLAPPYVYCTSRTYNEASWIRMHAGHRAHRSGYSCGAADVCSQEVERRNLQDELNVQQKQNRPNLNCFCVPKLFKRRATEDMLVNLELGRGICIRKDKNMPKRYTMIRCTLLLALDTSRQLEILWKSSYLHIHMPVRTIENCQGIISVCPHMTINTNVTRLKLVTAEHNDVPVDHRHAKALFLFAARFEIGI